MAGWDDLEHVLQNGGIRLKPDIDEHTAGILNAGCCRAAFAQTDGGNGVLADDLLDRGFQRDFDFLGGRSLIEQRPLGAQVLATMKDGDAAGVFGQHYRLIDSGIASADDTNFAARKESAIAGGAMR